MRLWLGGYTADMEGSGLGIGVLHVGAAAEQSARGSLTFAGTAVEVDSPSWLAKHPSLDVVYAALEGAGGVQAFRRTGDETLRPLGVPQITGDSTCHLAVSADGTRIVATAYGDGNVSFIPLNAKGELGTVRQGVLPTDPYGSGEPQDAAASAGGFEVAGAAEWARASGELAGTPAGLPGADIAAAADLSAASAALRAAVGSEFAHLVPGHDDGDAALREALGDDYARLIAGEPSTPTPATVEEIPEAEEPAGRVPHAHQARFVGGGLVATTDLGFDMVRFWRGTEEVQQVVLPYGTGPRHTVWHPSGHLYVVSEYSCEVFVLAPDRAGRWRLVSSSMVSTSATVGTDYPGELSMSADGTVLYAGVRGSNTIAALAVKDNGARLEPIAAVDSHVNWPRHHVLVTDTLLVAGQRSEDVVSLAIDERTQLPTILRSRTSAPTPSVLLPIFD